MDIYDLDGSAADVVAPFVAAGKAEYFPRFPAMISAHVGELAAAAKHEPADGRSCAIQELHCLFRHRGRSRWVVPRLDPDEYFVNSNPSSRVFQDFEQGAWFGDPVLRASLSAVYVASVEFGGPPEAPFSSPPPVRFVHR